MSTNSRHLGPSGAWREDRPLRGEDLLFAPKMLDDDDDSRDTPPVVRRVLRTDGSGKPASYHSPHVSAVLGNPFMSRLRTEERAQFLEAGQWITFKPNEVICQQGKPVASIIFIALGTARGEVCVPINGSFQMIATFLGPGDDIGLFSLLDGAPNQATVTAQEGLHALVVPVAAMGSWLQKYPELYRVLANLMAERLRLRGVYLQALI